MHALFQHLARTLETHEKENKPKKLLESNTLLCTGLLCLWFKTACSRLLILGGFYLCAIIKVCNYPHAIKKFERSQVPLVETFFALYAIPSTLMLTVSNWATKRLKYPQTREVSWNFIFLLCHSLDECFGAKLRMSCPSSPKASTCTTW